MDYSQDNFLELLRELNEIGIALSAEKDQDRLLEMILLKAMEITHADGGTLYSKTEDQKLKFEILHNHSLNIHMGGSSGENVGFYPIKLYEDDGSANDHMVASWTAITGETKNIEDAYASEEFDFSGTRNFDKKTGYRSESFLTVPMKDHQNEIIGVLQLINKKDNKTGDVMAFSQLDQQVVESLASQAAVTITKKQLIDAQRDLFDSFIQLIADTIDEKSPYTAGHCRRVPVITNMLADAVSSIDRGPLKTFSMNEDEKYELEVAAWLHDCGKITTPEYVVDKGTKLETIYDRINEIDVRIEVLRRDAIIDYLKARITELDSNNDVEIAIKENSQLQSTLQDIEQARDYIHQYNVGGESLDEADLSRIADIAKHNWLNAAGEGKRLLDEEEKQNLEIGRGTLTMREREIINNHVCVSIKMLEALPYPKHLRRVPEYAGGHHEKIDGTGYPNKLTGDQMSVQARIVAIADVFEALTASDRPYKKAMPLSQSLKILGQMKIDRHIDGDLFDIFINEKIYLKYAREYLDESQIDEISFDDIPGYVPLQ